MFQPLVLCISNKITLHLPVFVSETVTNCYADVTDTSHHVVFF